MINLNGKQKVSKDCQKQGFKIDFLCKVWYNIRSNNLIEPIGSLSPVYWQEECMRKLSNTELEKALSKLRRLENLVSEINVEFQELKDILEPEYRKRKLLSIEKLNLSTKTYNALLRKFYDKGLEELSIIPWEDFKNTRNLGVEGQRELIRAMRNAGYEDFPKNHSHQDFLYLKNVLKVEM